MTRRTDRINEQLRSEIARILHEEVTDPRIGLVVLTRIDVSPDLRNARVLWSRLEKAAMPNDDLVPDADPEVQDGLDSAAGFVRRRLAQALPLKRVPALHFQFDPSIAVGSRTLARIQDLSDGEEDSDGAER